MYYHEYESYHLEERSFVPFSGWQKLFLMAVLALFSDAKYYNNWALLALVKEVYYEYSSSCS